MGVAVWVRAILPQLLGQPLVYDSSRAPPPAPGAWPPLPLSLICRWLIIYALCCVAGNRLQLTCIH